jgi:hypothetical protein
MDIKLDQQILFNLFVTEIVLGFIGISLSIATGIQSREAAQFKEIYTVVKCGVRDIVRIESRSDMDRPFYQNVSNESIQKPCYFYKHRPDEILLGDPKELDSALVTSMVICWLVFIAVGIALKMGSK